MQVSQVVNAQAMLGCGEIENAIPDRDLQTTILDLLCIVQQVRRGTCHDNSEVFPEERNHMLRLKALQSPHLCVGAIRVRVRCEIAAQLRCNWDGVLINDAISALLSAVRAWICGPGGKDAGVAHFVFLGKESFWPRIINVSDEEVDVE